MLFGWNATLMRSWHASGC